MNKFKLSAIASTVLLSAAVFTGCGSSSAGTISDSVNIADGYVIKLPSAASVTCTDGRTASTTTVGAKGKVIFDGLTLDSSCTITVPSDAIIDVNNNGVYDASVDKASGFEMKANGAAAYVSHLTTLVEAQRAEGKDVSALAALVNNFDPVTALTNTLSGTTAQKNQAQNLVKLGEVAKNILSSKSSAGIGKINTANFTQSTSVISNAQVETAVTVTGIDATVVTTVKAADAAIEKVIALAPSLDAAKLDAIFTLVSDGSQTISEAVTDSGATAPTDTTVLDSINEADQLITQKQVAETKSGTTVTQSLELGTNLTIGVGTSNSQVIALDSNGTFTDTITYGSKNLSDYFDVSFPSATLALDEAFATQTVSLSVEIKNSVDSGDMIKLTVPGIKLDKNGTTGIKLTVPSGTVISATQTGLTGLTNFASGATVTSTTNTELVNTDLALDVDTLISSLGGSSTIGTVISELNTNFFKQEKTYNVTLKVTGNDIDVLPIEFTTITGTITVTASNPS